MTLLIPKMNPIRDRKYLDSLHSAPSIITGLRGETVEPAHLGAGGRGLKRGDNEVLPIEHEYHAYGHQHGEASMWRKYLPDHVLMEALRCYARQMYKDYKESN